MHLTYTWTDVFAVRPLTGNQLCTFDAPAALSPALMAQVTRELAQSESTFLQAPQSSGADVRVRIFVPTGSGAVEIPFAGHPLLGSAAVYAARRGAAGLVRLETGVGIIPVTVTELPGPAPTWAARMRQPLPRLVQQIARSGALAEALGLTLDELRTDLPVEAVDNGMRIVLIPAHSVAAVQRAQPNMAALRGLLGRDGSCTLLFAPGGVEPEADVHCRVFSPFELVTEDPATGSANGPLGEYLVRHGAAPGPLVHSEQGYAIGRPSHLLIDVERTDGQTTAVYVGGQVYAVGKGSFTIDA